MAVPRPCLVCGTPSLNGARCEIHGQPFKGRKQAYGTPVPQSMRVQVLTSQPRCACTGCARHIGPCHLASEHVDHIINRANGGSDARSNLQGLCKGCHMAKTAHEGHLAARSRRN